MIKLTLSFPSFLHKLDYCCQFRFEMIVSVFFLHTTDAIFGLFFLLDFAGSNGRRESQGSLSSGASLELGTSGLGRNEVSLERNMIRCVSVWRSFTFSFSFKTKITTFFFNQSFYFSPFSSPPRVMFLVVHCQCQQSEEEAAPPSGSVI